jgi:hypothetical protein
MQSSALFRPGSPASLPWRQSAKRIENGGNMGFTGYPDIASLGGPAFAILLLSLSNAAALGAAQCDQESTIASSQLGRARASQNSMVHSNVDEKCRVVIAQFVEAVTARQAAATCQDSVGGQRALRVIDAEIEKFNDSIAEQSCGQ